MSDAIQRSTFVTVLAWIFIIFSGFGTVASVLQNIMIYTVFNDPQFGLAMEEMPPDMSGFEGFAVGNFHLLASAALLLTIIVLAASIGLLKRKNWARKMFICFMALGILWNLGVGTFQMLMFSSMQKEFATAAANAPDMSTFFLASAIVGVVFILGAVILFGWIIKRLISPEIVAEFHNK